MDEVVDLVSVIIPAYNAEKHISSCLEALLNQTLASDQYEAIVVNDGSTDRTEEIVRQYDAVRLISQPNNGPAIARNRGVSESKGEIVIFIDSDCVPETDWLEEMSKPFDDPRIVGVQGRYKTKQGELVARFAQLEIEERYKKMLREQWIDFIGTYSAGYRKTEFEECGGFDSRFPIASGEDADLSYTMSEAGHRLVFNPNAVVYHQHPRSLRIYFRQKFGRAYWRILLYRKNIKKVVKDSYTPQLLKIQVMLLGLIFLFLLVGSLVIPRLIIGIMVSGVLLLIASYVPFIIYVAKRDHVVGLVSPFFLTIRASALLCGLIAGFIKEGLLVKGSRAVRRKV